MKCIVLHNKEKLRAENSFILTLTQCDQSPFHATGTEAGLHSRASFGTLYIQRYFLFVTFLVDFVDLFLAWFFFYFLIPNYPRFCSFFFLYIPLSQLGVKGENMALSKYTSVKA